MATTRQPRENWRTAFAGLLALAAGLGVAAGCQVGPTHVAGAEYGEQEPVSVTVAVPRQPKQPVAPGLSRGVLATDFSQPLKVRLASTGVGHDYILGWKFETDLALVEDPLDPGILKANYTGITAQPGRNRIFRAQIYDAVKGLPAPNIETGWPIRAFDEVWGVSDVPAATTVVLTHETTPTAKVMRELLLTADGQRAENLAVADVQALVDRIRTYDEVAGAPRATAIPGLHIRTEPIALAIANGAQDASGVYQPYVVPSPTVANGLVPAPTQMGQVRVQVLDSLGKAATGGMVLTLDDPLTPMAQVASGTAAAYTWSSVPVTMGSNAFQYWTGTVVEPATGRSDTGKFTLAGGDNVTYTLSLPLKGLSERIAGGPGVADSRWGTFPLQKKLVNPQHLLADNDVIYWIEDGVAGASDTLNAMDMKQPNPRVEVIGTGHDLTGVTIDHVGNPVYTDVKRVYAGATLTRVYSKIYRKKYFSGGTTATDPIVPEDGSTELVVDCDTMSGWGTMRAAGPIAFDLANKRLIMHGGGNFYRLIWTSTTPNVGFAANGGTATTGMRVVGSYLYYGHTWNTGGTDPKDLFNLRRRHVTSYWDDALLNGSTLTYGATDLGLDGFGWSRPSNLVALGRMSGAPAVDAFGNVYACVDGRVLRYSSAYSGTWLTDTRLRGDSLAYDAGRNWLYFGKSTGSPHEIRRVKVE